jgi:REP-associated tyrosine transposase
MTELIRKKVKRYNIAGHVHSLTFSCYRRARLFDAEVFRNMMIESLVAAKQKHAYYLLAFVIMPEHVHLLVSPHRTEYNISGFLQGVKQPVARKAGIWLRKNNVKLLEQLQCFSKGGYRFRFWQAGGGYDRNILSRETMLKVIEYIHANPVRRKLVEQPSDYWWSSAAWFEGKEEFCLRADKLP